MFDDGLKVSLSEYLPLRDVVFNTLREAILKGELKPGERMMEKQLAEKMGVSRTPIREAIRKLELEGLVVMVPRKGAQVASITEKEVKNVLEVRAALEELAVKLACQRMDKNQINELKSIMFEFDEASEEKDVNKLVAADIKFHDTIFKAAQNEKLQQIINNLREQIFRYRLAYLRNNYYHEIIRREHQEMIDAIENNDEDKAAKVASVHIMNQEKSVITMMKKEKQL